MTYQSDYVLRAIEQFAQAVATLRNRLLGRRPDKEPLAGEVKVIAARADIDLDVARAVDSETLRLLMSTGGELDRGRCWMTAELLVVEALDAAATGDGVAAAVASGRAFELYTWLPPDWRPLADEPTVAERLAQARGLLAGAGEST